MNQKITTEQLERLEDSARKDKDGMANFKLIEHKNGDEHFIFRVVCQRFLTTKGIIKHLQDSQDKEEELVEEKGFDGCGTGHYIKKVTGKGCGDVLTNRFGFSIKCGEKGVKEIIYCDECSQNCSSKSVEGGK